MKNYFLYAAIMFMATTASAQAKVVGEETSYSADGITMKGYIAYDNSIKGRRPGVLVVHEWWGHNDYARSRARMLAKLGYTAIAVDMYGDGKTAAHPKEAGEFSGAVRANMDGAEKRFVAAMDTLRAHKTVDGSRIAAIGYCFGGGLVVEMARRGVDLNGVASFHGNPGTQKPVAKGVIKGKLLVMNGAADPFIKPETIKAFEDEMKKAGVDYRFINYPNAKHAFTNPGATALGKQFGLPLEYNKAADNKSWKELKGFLKKIF